MSSIITALILMMLAALPSSADEANPAAYDKQPCATASDQDREATRWPTSHHDPRLQPLQRLLYTNAVDSYLECASRRDTPPRLRLTARVRAVEIYDAIGYVAGEYPILGDIAHDPSVPSLSRERAKEAYFKICHTVLSGHDEEQVHAYCDVPFDSDANGAGALHDRLTKSNNAPSDGQKKNAQNFDHQNAGCKTPNADAAVIGNAPAPAYPYPESASGVGGTAQIKVQLDETGKLLDATIYRSTGNAHLDDAALNAARATSFSPEIHNCTAVSGSFMYRADFSQAQQSK